MSEGDSPKDNKDFFPERAIKDITQGVLAKYQPPLEKTKKQLTELLQKQEMLTSQLHNENLEVSWKQNSVELQKMFDTIAAYHNKLVNIKKDMRSIHDKSFKLKKRALHLQQYKEKNEYLEKQQRQMEFQREQDLIGGSSKFN